MLPEDIITPSSMVIFSGQVLIKKNAYIGMNTLVVKPVTIGENAIVGAGSVVTHDIPDNEIWAGNPARCIGRV